MRSRKINIALFLVGSLLLVQCSSALKTPTVADSQTSGESMEVLKEGRKLYIKNCSSCHYLYLPEKYTKADWAYNLDFMQERAKINDEQKEIILKYLFTGSKK